MLRRAHVHVGASRPSLSLRRPAALQTRVASASARRPTLPALSGDVTPVRGYSKAIKRRLEEKRSAVREEKERALEEEPVDVKVEMKPPAPWREEKWGEVRLLVLHPVTESAKYSHADYLLHEAVGLAEACGWKVLEAQKVPLHQMNYASYFGTGKIEELGAAIRAANYNVVYIDAFLNPAQVQKLSQRWVEMSGRELRVVDRFAVILEIFSIRAQSRESKLQVELAWIEYQRTFLVGKHSQEFKGEHQRGGRGFTSGSGETQLEIDRRRLSDRAAHVKKQLQTIAQTHELHMLHRARLANIPLVAVVGYTNVGKSMLVNRLTGAALASKDELFTSLSPFHRVAVLPSLGVKAMFMDTVGFISHLPHALFAAFKATLDEILSAQLVLHVRDIAHPEAEFQREQVHKVLSDLKLSEALMKSHVEVWNKIDLVDEDQVRALMERAIDSDAARDDAAPAPRAGGSPRNRRTYIGKNGASNGAAPAAFPPPSAIVPISALQGVGLPHLVRAIEERVADAAGVEGFDLEISPMDVQQVQYLYSTGAVVQRSEAKAEARAEGDAAEGGKGKAKAKGKAKRKAKGDEVEEAAGEGAAAGGDVIKMRVTFTAHSLRDFKAKFTPLSMRKVPRSRLIRTHVAPAAAVLHAPDEKV